MFVITPGPANADGYGGGSNCPSVHNLQPANGCGSYTVTFGCDNYGRPTATFTCCNTQAANGDCVTGFACYWIGPGTCKPVCQSAPSNCQTTSYGSYCNSVWDYNCYPTCSQNCNTSSTSGGSTNCGGSSTGGSSGGSTNCGSSSGGYSGGTTNCTGGYGSTGGTNCGGGYGAYGIQAQDCSGSTGGSSTGGYSSTGGTNCGGSSTGGGNSCWYNQCYWLPQGCVTPGNCSQPKCFTLTYPCGTKLCASDFCCGVHCYQQTGCDYWCMCGNSCLGKLSVTVSPSSVCITNKESTQLTYTVTNTGTGNVTNVSVTDNFGTVASGLTLTPSQSVTETRTISNQNTSFTDDISASGTDTNGSTVNAGNTISVDVVHPALTLTAVAGPLVGNQVTITYTLTNTGDDTINNITVTGYVNGSPSTLTTVASLAQGASQTITQTVTVNGPTSVYATASGTDACASVPVTVTSTPVQPPAIITGIVNCASCSCAVNGATVELLSGTNVVATTTTNSSGGFTFENEPTGTYSIEVVDSPDYNTYTGATFSFNSAGSNDNVGTIGLTPAPISYLSQAGGTLGQVWFGTAAFWQSYGFTLGTTTLMQSDLSTSTYVSSSTVYPYADVIPEYPELGTFSGNIYVLVEAPLVNADTWNNASFVDLVGLAGVWPTGSGSEGTVGDFTLREYFDQPFTGPGTAYSYAVTGLNFTAPSPAPAYSVTPLPAVWAGTGPAPTPPASGTYPAGWMAQSQVQWVLPPLTNFTFFINGGYNDICGDQFIFSICPTGTTP